MGLLDRCDTIESEFISGVVPNLDPTTFLHRKFHCSINLHERAIFDQMLSDLQIISLFYITIKLLRRGQGKKSQNWSRKLSLLSKDEKNTNKRVKQDNITSIRVETSNVSIHKCPERSFKNFFWLNDPPASVKSTQKCPVKLQIFHASRSTVEYTLELSIPIFLLPFLSHKLKGNTIDHFLFLVNIILSDI